MPWYDEAVFYHIYPLGLTGAPQQNSYQMDEPRLRKIFPWISHIRKIGCNALYIGPLFESVGHGYETTDYKKLDSRLGSNQDLVEFVKECHNAGIRVILDGVFNHTGRDFFAFQDLKKKRENSVYKDWYCNVNFWGNNEYNDGFSYENWGGYNLLVKLNQRNPEVRNYICDVIRFWVSEFDIDGIRLDAADVLDFDYMKAMRQTANEVKDDFWLMGEVIHGDYTRWVNSDTLHSVTNYQLHKALYSGHNDHNYFEIAHTVKRFCDQNGQKLYNFVDNHDVARIYTKLNEKKHFVPVHVLLYTLPGIPSIYYGSEFGIEGQKQSGSDASLRPALSYEQYADSAEMNERTKVIAALGEARQHTPALVYGDYRELFLTTGQYAFSRNWNGQSVLVTVNNATHDFTMDLQMDKDAEYVGILSGERVRAAGGRVSVSVCANSGEVWIPADGAMQMMQRPALEVDQNRDSADIAERAAGLEKVEVPQKAAEFEKVEVSQKVEEPERAETVVLEEQESAEEQKSVAEQESAEEQKIVVDWSKPYEAMSIEELQEAILEKMRKNGPITERMLREVRENVYHNSLINWVKSFR